MREASYTALSITRKHLIAAGVEEQYVDLLTNDEIQTIATRIGNVLATSEDFNNLVSLVTWSLILESDLSALFGKEE